MKYSIIIYDTTMKKVAYLQNAYDVWYELKLNELWTCGFKLLAEDKKNQYCKNYYYVELFDGNRRVELFRIMPNRLSRDNLAYIEYECEHVLSTLFDDVLFQYHQIGNLGIYTNQVLRYVIDRQTTKNWELYQCDFSRQFEYKWENENLLAALFSIPQPFIEKYRWEFETRGYPWKISLKKLSSNYKADIQYRKNLKNIVKTEDPTNLVTRLFLLGYGEGDNQLNIKSINNGLPYIEKNVGKYGLKSSILTDRRFEHPETLLEYGKTMLNELSEPYTTYGIKTADLYRYDKKKYAPYFPGDSVLVRDKEDNIDLVIPIVSVKKNDVTGNYFDVDVQVANKSKDIAGTIAELQNRARINDTYSQGATNLQQIAYADNADRQHPLKIKFYLPQEMVRINKLLLHYTIENFRSYSKGSKAGGGQYTSTSSGGGSYQATSTSYDGGTYSTTHGEADVDGSNVTYPVYSNQAGWSGNVTIYYVRHHEHRYSSPDHSHGVQIEVRDHSHGVETREHEHDQIHGIYEGGRADRCYLKVDGQTVYNYDTEVDIIPYLSKDGGGKIRRDAWHTIEIIPDDLTRINASLFVQLFTNSRGGGDF